MPLIVINLCIFQIEFHVSAHYIWQNMLRLNCKTKKRETFEWTSPAITSPWPLEGAVGEVEGAEDGAVERESGGKAEEGGGVKGKAAT